MDLLCFQLAFVERTLNQVTKPNRYKFTHEAFLGFEMIWDHLVQELVCKVLKDEKKKYQGTSNPNFSANFEIYIEECDI